MKQHTILTALVILGAFVFVIVPYLTLAQETGRGLSFVHSVSLWAAIVIGVITSGAVFHNAHKIGGGVLRSVYYYFAAGMFIIVLGFLAVVVPPWADAFVIMRTHDLLFVVGYGVMAYGAKQMLLAVGMKP